MTTEIDIGLDRDFVDTVVEQIIPEHIDAIECASRADDRLVYFMGGDGTIHVHRRHSGATAATALVFAQRKPASCISGWPTAPASGKSEMTIKTRTPDKIIEGVFGKQDVSTPAGGGDLTPAAEDRSTSQGLRFPGEASAVTAPPEPDEAPAKASADETGNKPEHFFGYVLSGPPEDDDTDEFAFPHSRRVIFSASSDGIISIHHRHSAGITLTAAEARDLYSFLTDVALIWRRAK